MNNTLLFLASLFAIPVTVFAQSKAPNGIPQKVYYMQLARYSKAENLMWTALPDSTYQVQFKLNGKAGMAHYDKNSAEIDAQSEIDSASVPSAILQKVFTQYPGYRFNSCRHYKTSMPILYPETFLHYAYEHYVVLATFEKKSYKLYFSPEGALLNRP